MDAAEALRLASVTTFLVALLVKIRAQKRRGIQPIVIGGSGVRRAEPLEVSGLFSFFGLLALDAVLPELLGEALFEGPVYTLSGSVLLVAAPALFVTAFVHMGRSWRIGIDRNTKESLVTVGIFGWSRNPIFLALDLLFLGAALQTGKLLFLVGAPLVALLVHVQVLKEESFLRRQWGPTYDDYCARVGRYFGRARV